MAETERNFENDIIKSFEHWTLYLHENQSYLGRAYLALNRGEVGEEIDPFVDTLPQEKSESELIFGALKGAYDELFQPTRINYANLRNSWLKCHWHIIPRYEGPDFGLRIFDNFGFRDFHPGKNYAPAPNFLIPDSTFDSIKYSLHESISQKA